MMVVIKIVKLPITINGTTLEPDDGESIILAADGVLAIAVPKA